MPGTNEGEIITGATTINALYPITPYQPTEWKTGDIVSSQGLNKIENNIGPLIVNFDVENDGYINASYNDIKDAILAGRPVFLMIAANITDSHGTGFTAEMASFCIMRDNDGLYNALFALPGGLVGSFSEDGVTEVFATDPDEPMSLNEPTLEG